MPQANLMETFTQLRFPHSRFVKATITSPSVIALIRMLITVKTQTILSLRSCVNITIYSPPYKSQSSKTSTLKFQDLFKNPSLLKSYILPYFKREERDTVTIKSKPKQNLAAGSSVCDMWNTLMIFWYAVAWFSHLPVLLSSAHKQLFS